MIREDVELLMDEIRQKLKSGQASLMVGSGFSRNAETASPNTPLPPSWSDLKQVLVERLYGMFPERYRQKMADSKTVLQLAQEYDQRGRTELNLLLKELIRDNEIFPGELHKSILQLPWRDVFTTNYDTLLERAATQVVEQKYSPVYCCKDLALSEQPRIIKLHGSIHSESTPMIVTEEDYRSYPNKYALFVNTVQQAITETSLCLVGFSGTDPNFLKWIGWVRDNLKESMPQIYLIGKLNLSDSEYRVLIKYRIRPVDLSLLDEKKGPKELLDIFVQNITSPPSMKWDLPFDHFSPTPQIMQDADARKRGIKELLQNWRKKREEYPKWRIVPSEWRNKLVTLTERWTDIPKWCSELPSPEDIQLLYEYNWRIEHCLMPLIEGNAKHYEEILRHHNPLKIKCNEYFSKDVVVPAEDDADRVTRSEMWIQLMFAVLRWHREEGHEDGFSKYKNILQKVVKYYPEYAERLFYERALFSLSLPNFEELTRVMTEWKKHLSIPEWTLKYAALTAELGNSEEAKELLKLTLPTIRQGIPKESIKNDFYCLYLEGVVLTALIMYEQGNRLNEYDANKQDNNDDAESDAAIAADFPGDRERTYRDILPPKKVPLSPNRSQRLRAGYRQRLTNLKANYCDPNDELNLFRLSLSHSLQQEPGEKEIRVFDINIKTSFMITGWDKNIIIGYQFVRYLEETGLPLYLNNVTFIGKSLTDAAKRIAPFSPPLAFAVLNRVGITDRIDYECLFSQRIVSELPQETVDVLLRRYVKAVQWLINNATEKINDSIGNFYSYTLKKLLETISRLEVKASPTVLQDIFDLIMQFYGCGVEGIIVDMPLRNCVRRLFKTMPTNMLCDNIGILLQIPVKKNDFNANFFVNPFDYIDSSKGIHAISTGAITDSLNTWIERMNADEIGLRKIALKVLFVSNELGLMTDQQQKKFAQLFFSSLNAEGLPTWTDFYPWVFLSIAKFSGTVDDIGNKLLKFYKNFLFKIDRSNDDSTSQFDMICYSMLVNLSVTKGSPENRLRVDWNDVREIFEHIRSAVEEFGQNINDLSEAERDVALRNVQKNLLYIDRIVAEVVIPDVGNDLRLQTQLKNFVQNAEMLQPFPSSRVALLQKGDCFHEDLETSFIFAISSTDCDRFTLYSWALHSAYIRAAKKMGPAVPKKIFYSLLTAVGTKNDQIFRLACQAITLIFDYYDSSRQEDDLLLQYLSVLENETRFSAQNSRFPLDSRYDYRIAAGGLAARMYKKYKDSGAIPHTLQRWNEICHSAMEFSSLRNKWESVINDAR